jgi:hypothetical protein
MVFPGKYLSLTSYRRDGGPVATPVWFVQVAARADVLGPEMLEQVRRQMGRKYRFDRIFFLPFYRAVQALRSRPVRGERSVIVAITPI